MGKLLNNPCGKLLNNPCGKLLNNPCGKLLNNPCGKLLNNPCGKLINSPYEKTDMVSFATTGPFTMTHVHNKNLVIQMLKYEEELTRSDYGQSLYKNTLNKPLISLTIEKAINRLVLDHFNFETDDTSVENYRTIFKTYYRSALDYDKEVLDSVHYMRENKCVYYKNQPLKIGEKIPNCSLYSLDGNTQTTLYDIIQKSNMDYTVVAAFSLS